MQCIHMNSLIQKAPLTLGTGSLGSPALAGYNAPELQVSFLRSGALGTISPRRVQLERAEGVVGWM